VEGYLRVVVGNGGVFPGSLVERRKEVTESRKCPKLLIVKENKQ